MKKPTIAIIGGSNEGTYRKVAAKQGANILFNCGKVRNGGSKKDFRPIIKKCDVCIILLGAIGHVTQDVVKELCKENGVKLVFQEGFGATGAITAGLNAINNLESLKVAG
jgi:hypothetical protein